MKTGFQRKIAVAAMYALFLCSISASCLASELTLRAYNDTRSIQGSPGYWTVSLRSNHPVFPSSLKNATKVFVNGDEQQFELRDSQSDQKASAAAKEFKIVPSRRSRVAASVKVVVDKTLSDASGRNLMAREYTYQFFYGQNITVSSLTTFFRSRSDKGLKLELSAAVDQNELTAAMHIFPSVTNMSVTRSGEFRYQITGDFEYGREYVLQIASVPLNSGQAVLVEGKHHFHGPGIEPLLAVRTERSVVELRGKQLLPLTLADVTKVRCKLTRIPPYLAPQLLSDIPVEKVRHPEPQPDELEDRDPDEPEEDRQAPQAPRKIERPSRAIEPIQSVERNKALQSLTGTGRVFAGFLGEFTGASEAFFAPEARDRTLGYSLPLSFRASPDKGGIWVASLSDPDSNFKGETSRVVQVTDLSVTYKVSAKNLLLWVTSLHTGQPVPGVELMLDRADGFRSFVGKTDKGGVLFLREGDKFPSVQVGQESSGITNQPLSLTQVKWAIAATNADACAVQLNDLRLKPRGVNQAKDVQDAPDARTGYLFTERGVYRPGETVQFKFFARAYRNDQIVAPSGEKPKLEIVGPREDIVYSKELTLSEFGTCHDTFKLESYFPVGTYLSFPRGVANA
ncbi:MAG: MG2 domain-containing protein [Desulfomonilaceae bacterium]